MTQIVNLKAFIATLMTYLLSKVYRLIGFVNKLLYNTSARMASTHRRITMYTKKIDGGDYHEHPSDGPHPTD